MKFEHNSKMTTIAIYAFLVLASVIVFWMLIGNIGHLFGWLGKVTGFITPVIYGFVFAYLLNPILRFFDDRLLPKAKIFLRLKPATRRGISLILTYLSAFIFIGIFLAIVITQVGPSIRDFINNTSNYYKYLYNLYIQFSRLISEVQLLGNSQSTDLINSLARSLINSLQGMIEGFSDWLSTLLSVHLISATTSFTSSILNFVLGIIVSIYFLADREKLFAQTWKITTAVFKEDTRNLLYDITMDSHRVFSGFIIGKIIDSAIIGVLCFIGISLFRIHSNPMLISLIIGVTNVIPYFGPFIGAIPGFFLVFVSYPDPVDGLTRGIIFLVFILLLQQFDGNILGPKILGDTTGLSALWVVFSIMLFSGLFGILGMFIGVPLFAVLYSLSRRFINYLLRRRGKTESTREYASEKNPLIK